MEELKMTCMWEEPSHFPFTVRKQREMSVFIPDTQPSVFTYTVHEPRGKCPTE